MPWYYWYSLLKNPHWFPPLELGILTSSAILTMVCWLPVQKFIWLLGLLSAHSLSEEPWALWKRRYLASGSEADKFVRIQAAAQAGFPAPKQSLQASGWCECRCPPKAASSPTQCRCSQFQEAACHTTWRGLVGISFMSHSFQSWIIFHSCYLQSKTVKVEPAI